MFKFLLTIFLFEELILLFGTQRLMRRFGLKMINSRPGVLIGYDLKFWLKAQELTLASEQVCMCT